MAYQLLPSMTDEITLEHIASRLSWKDDLVLASVNRAWCHAIRSREVYDARVRRHSTGTLVLINYTRSLYCNAIVLYSMADDTSCKLPPIPNVDGGVPSLCQCVSLDGNIYVLGGVVHHADTTGGSDKVYVFDLAGQRQWKPSASMREPRVDFGCGVIEGKIYVCGGTSSTCNPDKQPVCVSEVFDPTENKWSIIKPMISFRYDHSVETVGDELVVHGGQFYNQDYFDATENMMEDPFDSSDEDSDYIRRARFLEIYHPVKDEWRMVDTFRKRPNTVLFMAQGNFYTISEKNRFSIHAHNADKTSWKRLHSCSFDTVGPLDSVFVMPYAVLAVGCELLAIVYWYNRASAVEGSRLIQGSCLVRSRGLGSKLYKEIIWERTNVPLPYSSWPPVFAKHFMYPIQV